MNEPEGYDQLHGPATAEPVPLAEVATGQFEQRPSGALWMWYLFFRPTTFFRHFVLDPSPGLTALAAWMLGVAGIMSEIDSRPNLLELVLTTWSGYWLLCLAGGLLGALVYFKVGGWWYHVRLRWSGAVNPDVGLARRVYLFASQVEAIPMVLYTIWETSHYATPAEARSGSDTGGMVLVLFLFWSVCASYRGVRTAFVVRAWAARLWFVVLPSLVYSVILVGVLLAFLGSTGVLSTLPAVDAPEIIDRPAFTLKYPSNWMVNTEDDDYDPDHQFRIEPMLPDASATFTIYDEPVLASEAADETLRQLDSMHKLLDKQPVEAWGRYSGSGYRIRADINGKAYAGLVFAATTEQRGFEVFELCGERILDKQQPGFELIRKTFRVKE